MAQTVKNLPAMLETWVQPLSQEDPLEKGMATHSSILGWRTPWTEEPGGLQSMGSPRVGHDWVTNTHTHRAAKRTWLNDTHTPPPHTHSKPRNSAKQTGFNKILRHRERDQAPLRIYKPWKAGHVFSGQIWTKIELISSDPSEWWKKLLMLRFP